MKKILNLAWNDIKIEFSERSTLFMFFILPLIFTAILGVSFGGNGDPDADRRYLVPVVDMDGTNLSRELIAALENSEIMRPELTIQNDADRLLKDGESAPATPRRPKRARWLSYR